MPVIIPHYYRDLSRAFHRLREETPPVEECGEPHGCRTVPLSPFHGEWLQRAQGYGDAALRNNVEIISTSLECFRNGDSLCFYKHNLVTFRAPPVSLYSCLLPNLLFLTRIAKWMVNLTLDLNLQRERHNGIHGPPTSRYLESRDGCARSCS
jgi:hypothetical protein